MMKFLLNLRTATSTQANKAMSKGAELWACRLSDRYYITTNVDHNNGDVFEPKCNSDYLLDKTQSILPLCNICGG